MTANHPHSIKAYSPVKAPSSATVSGGKLRDVSLNNINCGMPCPLAFNIICSIYFLAIENMV